MTPMAAALKVQGLPCVAQHIAKSVEHMFRDVREVKIIHKLRGRLAKVHDWHGKIYKGYPPLVWPEKP
jgi:hypothetical protein